MGTVQTTQIDSATGIPTDQGSTGKAAHTTSPQLTYITYTGGGYTYYCEAIPGTARSTAAWQVIRKNEVTGDMVFAGTGQFAHSATDLNTVAALSYTLGA